MEQETSVTSPRNHRGTRGVEGTHLRPFSRDHTSPPTEGGTDGGDRGLLDWDAPREEPYSGAVTGLTRSDVPGVPRVTSGDGSSGTWGPRGPHSRDGQEERRGPVLVSTVDLLWSCFDTRPQWDGSRRQDPRRVVPTKPNSTRYSVPTLVGTTVPTTPRPPPPGKTRVVRGGGRRRPPFPAKGTRPPPRPCPPP